MLADFNDFLVVIVNNLLPLIPGSSVGIATELRAGRCNRL
jgi:hypothetical protein